MDNKKFKKAFTLAEVLITLTIIGVIAALTIPGLRNHSYEASLVAQTKKAYLTAANAIASAEAKYGDLELWDWSNASQITNYFKSSMSLAPNTGFSEYPMRFLDGSLWHNITSVYFQTNDGMMWYIYTFPNTSTFNNIKRYGIIHVDVNGPKGPNVIGEDMHAFNVSSDGVSPMGDGIHDEIGTWACTNYVIKHSKMPWYSNKSYTSCNNVYGQ